MELRFPHGQIKLKNVQSKLLTSGRSALQCIRSHIQHCFDAND